MFSKAYMDSMLNDHLLGSFEVVANVFIEGLSEFSSEIPWPARLITGLVVDWENARGHQEISKTAISNRLRSLLTNMRLSFLNIFPRARLRVMVSRFVGAVVTKTGELDELFRVSLAPAHRPNEKQISHGRVVWQSR